MGLIICLIFTSIEFRYIIDNRLVGYLWDKNSFILPVDPYGKNGPRLNDILYKNNNQKKFPKQKANNGNQRKF